ncbi:alpha/beta-hydrolase [Amylocystis lapponica]|nr:alpha/beta-hydrolase [Amylocystis lapponica]
MRLPAFLLISAVLSGVLGDPAGTDDITVSFSPRDFPKKVATCKAINRASEELKDIEIHYVEINPGAERTLLMVHGWPSLWHSWKFQIDEFKSDYHLIIPDLRGFGASTHPGDVESSGTWFDIVGDLTCVLAHAKTERAICVGHDWGTQMCYEAARERPDLFEAVIATVIPYIPSAGTPRPTSELLKFFPKLAYQLFLANHPLATAELGADVRRTLYATLRTVDSPPPDAYLRDTTSFLRAWDAVEEIPPIPFLTPEETDYWVEQYEIQRFKYNIQFYTRGNGMLSRTFITAQGNHTIPQPVLSILATDDPVGDWVLAQKVMGSEAFLPRVTTVLCKGAHWLQLENPREVNRHMREWLGALPSLSGADEQAAAQRGHVADEL